MSSLSFEDEMNQALRQPKSIGMNTIFQDAVQVCFKHNICYILESGRPSLFFVHPKNRGGLGLSWHNAHRNGDRVRAVGADKSQLQNAYAFEMAPKQSKAYEEQYKFNLSLIKRSDGLLAEPTTEERYLTLGCGHTVAFCKAAAAKCRTSEDGLADENGRIDLNRLFKNRVFESMIKDGWKWVIFPAWLDEQFPKLAEVGQAALNASHGVASLVGELEVAKSIVGYMQDGQEGWVASANEAIKAMGAPCWPYAHSIIKFVQKYCDGPSAPLVDILDGVAKKFQCNAVLGETFWTALVETKFQTKKTELPMLRCALLLANLTSPKFEDGIAKLLVKNDINRVATKQNVDAALLGEKVLCDALTIAKSVVKAKELTNDSIHGPFGRIVVRVALRAVGKEKDGREKKEYTMERIKELFLEEMKPLAGGDVTFKGWGNNQAAEEHSAKRAKTMQPLQPSKVQRPSKDEQIVSFQDHSSGAFKAACNGFTKGVVVYETKFGIRPTDLYVIEDINDAIAVLRVAVDYMRTNKKVTVETDVLDTDWAVYAKDMPSKVPFSELRPSQLAIDERKALAYVALLAVDKQYGVSSSDLEFYRRPDEVRVLKAFEKGELVLVPTAPLHSIVQKMPSSSHATLGEHRIKGVGAVSLYVVPPGKPKNDVCEHDGTLTAFFWVNDTHEESEVNMKYVNVKEGNSTVQTLQNSKKIAAYTKLMKFKPKEVKTSTMCSNVISVVTNAATASAK